MELSNIEVAHVEEVVQNAAEEQAMILNQLQSAYAGGGYGDIMAF